MPLIPTGLSIISSSSDLLFLPALGLLLANLHFQKLPTQKDSTNLEASRLPNFFGAFGLMLTGLIIVHSVPGPGLFWNVHQHQGLYMEAAQNHAFDGLAF